MSGADAAGPLADQATADLEAIRDVLLREIRRLLLRLNTEPNTDRLVGNRESISTARQVYLQVEELLASRGVPAVQTIAEQRALDAVDAVLPQGMAMIPADARRELVAVVSGQNKDVASVFGDLAGEIKRAIDLGTTTGASLADLVEVVEQRLNVSTSKAQAAVDSAVMAAGRRALVGTAAAVADDQGLDVVYEYVGPHDAKNRPFCLPLVSTPTAVTREYMLTMDNGQGLPVADFCGGYNCRHSWAPVMLEDAVSRGLRILG